ncbi:MAG: ABC transporter permease [Verrucomicrobia bacterium]|nr:ABC transporter permease [Verrucomicrobiota bacterium]
MNGSGPSGWINGVLGYIRGILVSVVHGPFELAAISTETLAHALRPHSWRKPVRSRFARQILFGGVEAVPFTVFAGGVIGVVLTLNSYQWLDFTGRIDFLAPALSVLIVREAAPSFACVILVAASASAMTTEIATMRITGEIDLIESQGINLTQFLVLPRAVGLAVAGTALASIFVACAFAASAFTILLIGRIPLEPFFNALFSAIVPADFLSLIGRGTVPAFLIGVICCRHGLAATGTATAIPQAVTRAMLGSVAAALLTSAVFALVTYL